LIIDKYSKDLQLKIQKIVNLLKPYTKRAYLVGGSVRDLLLNSEIRDIDIEVYDINQDKFDKIMQKNAALGVGKSFFVYKLDDIDLALPRIERKVGIGHKAFEVNITNDEKKASKRRDFTMNAMMINIFTGELLDFWGGQESVEKKEISLIDEQSFKEDSLRVLRAVQFSARFGFDIEDKTFATMKEIELADLTKPRIFWELEKLFNAKFLDIGFIYMYRLDLFEKLFTCKLNPKDVEKVIAELKEASFIEALRPYYFFYIVANICGFDAFLWFKKLEAPNHYLRVIKNQPFFEGEINDIDLHIVAIDRPIKDWLGNYKVGVVERAKRFGIYEEVFRGSVTIAKVIEDGFKKEEIKKEYRRRVISELHTKNRLFR
jgi:tRNA nucleotidyltransferase (CCA-adding enzyme)